MIYPDAERQIREAEPLAPKRLAREDVRAIRKLFARAQASSDRYWGDTMFIPLSRSKRQRALSLLGGHVPGALVRANQEQEGYALRIVVWAVAGERNDAQLRIGSHVFHHTTSNATRVRETSRLVRLALGWTRQRRQRLASILA